MGTKLPAPILMQTQSRVGTKILRLLRLPQRGRRVLAARDIHRGEVTIVMIVIIFSHDHDHRHRHNDHDD